MQCLPSLQTTMSDHAFIPGSSDCLTTVFTATSLCARSCCCSNIPVPGATPTSQQAAVRPSKEAAGRSQLPSPQTAVKAQAESGTREDACVLAPKPTQPQRQVAGDGDMDPPQLQVAGGTVSAGSSKAQAALAVLQQAAAAKKKKKGEPVDAGWTQVAYSSKKPADAKKTK